MPGESNGKTASGALGKESLVVRLPAWLQTLQVLSERNPATAP